MSFRTNKFTIPFSAQHRRHRGDGTHDETGPLTDYHYEVTVEYTYARDKFVKIEDVRAFIQARLAVHEGKPLPFEMRTLEGLAQYIAERFAVWMDDPIHAGVNQIGIQSVEVWEPSLNFGGTWYA